MGCGQLTDELRAIVTATNMAQTALTMLQEDLKLDGGVYTPACLGQPYLDRLDKAGMKIEVRLVPGNGQ
jgi:short subunit dehydrogenase-like uncharacterized protein